jgi:CheY-like chemotaxis protein
VSLERPKVLVVDDERELGIALERRLRRQCDVSFVTTARDALTLLANESVDVILCDLMMPDMTGLDLLEEISRTRVEYTSKVVFMTGGVFTPHIRDALRSVKNPRIDKPVDIEALQLLIREVMA